MSKEILMRVNPDGKIEIEGKNFVGLACDKAMKFLEDALGLVRSKKTKPEAYKREVQHDGHVGC